MKTAMVFLFAFVFIGCGNPPKKAALTAEEAKTLAAKLAYEKAIETYHYNMFNTNFCPEAHLANGRWIWRNAGGHGAGAYYAVVELALDGSTNSVSVKWEGGLP